MKKKYFKKAWSIIILIVICFSFSGCFDEQAVEEQAVEEQSNVELQGTKYDRNIAMVQQGYPELIPDISYEQAYNYFFENPQWRGFKADDGSEVVEFSGDFLYYEDDATVYIQFVIEDEQSFSLWYASVSVGEEKIVADDELIIDLIYSPFATYSEDVLGVELSQEVQDSFSEIYESLE